MHSCVASAPIPITELLPCDSAQFRNGDGFPRPFTNETREKALTPSTKVPLVCSPCREAVFVVRVSRLAVQPGPMVSCHNQHPARAAMPTAYCPNRDFGARCSLQIGFLLRNR